MSRKLRYLGEPDAEVNIPQHPKGSRTLGPVTG